MMERRQFLRYLALTSMAVTIPDQVAALERYYVANAPKAQGQLIAIDEISISGIASRSIPVTITAMVEERMALNLGLNLFGGIYRWIAPPDGKIIVRPDDFALVSYQRDAADWMTGHVRYIDQNAIRHSDPLDKWLVAPLEQWLTAQS